MTARDELLACPICKVMSAETYQRPTGLWYTSCENDDCAFTVETIGSSKEECERRWNTRAPTSDHRARPSMPDDDEDSRTFDDGVQHTVLLLAKWLDAEGWEMCDGSEDYDTDLGNTLLSILAAKGLYDKDECKWASLTAPSQGDAGAREDIQHLISGISPDIDNDDQSNARFEAKIAADHEYAKGSARAWRRAAFKVQQRAIAAEAALATPSDAGLREALIAAGQALAIQVVGEPRTAVQRNKDAFAIIDAALAAPAPAKVETE